MTCPAWNADEVNETPAVMRAGSTISLTMPWAGGCWNACTVPLAPGDQEDRDAGDRDVAGLAHEEHTLFRPSVCGGAGGEPEDEYRGELHHDGDADEGDVSRDLEHGPREHGALH